MNLSQGNHIAPIGFYIPDDALQVTVQGFEGPLDLLLYLIRKQNLDVLDIPVVQISRQFLRYLDVMAEMELQIAGEYLVMAATLAEIKSKMMLPPDPRDEEEDPRSNLAGQLIEYQRFMKAGEQLDKMPQMQREFYPVKILVDEMPARQNLPQLDIADLRAVMDHVLQDIALQTPLTLTPNTLSVEDKMQQILARLDNKSLTNFVQLLSKIEGREGVVFSFLSCLELCKKQLICIIQNEPYSAIYLRLSLTTK